MKAVLMLALILGVGAWIAWRSVKPRDRSRERMAWRIRTWMEAAEDTELGERAA
jgi:hypothetical protein